MILSTSSDLYLLINALLTDETIFQANYPSFFPAITNRDLFCSGKGEQRDNPAMSLTRFLNYGFLFSSPLWLASRYESRRPLNHGSEPFSSRKTCVSLLGRRWKKKKKIWLHPSHESIVPSTTLLGIETLPGSTDFQAFRADPLNRTRIKNVIMPRPV